MNKSDIVKVMAEKAGITQAQAKAALDAVTEETTKALASGDSVIIPGFATLRTGVRPARQGKNPLTGEPVEIAAKTVVKFKAGKALADALN